MKRLNIIFVALAIVVMCYSCSSSSGENGGGSGDNSDFPIGYLHGYPDNSVDMLLIEDNGSVLALHFDSDIAFISDMAEDTLSSSQMEHIANLCVAAGFNFSGKEIEYGTMSYEEHGYLLAIRGDESYEPGEKFEDKYEKLVALYGENPPDVPQAYIELRDYLKNLYSQILQ
jgi:hypothetical protein